MTRSSPALLALFLSLPAFAQSVAQSVDGGPEPEAPDAGAPAVAPAAVDADAGVDAGVDAGTLDGGPSDGGVVVVPVAQQPNVDEPKEVDGWTVISVVSDRRLPDGRPTQEKCGYKRDVIVEKVVTEPPKTPDQQQTQKNVVTKAVLDVPCVKDATTALLVAGKPALVLPPELAPKPLTTEATATDLTASATPRTCKEGEKPKKKDELAEGETACVAPKPRPCAADEKPKAKEELKEGELACKVMDSDRGVPFLKGELTHLGDVQLVNPLNSIGVGLGVAAIDNIYYAQLRPDVNFHYGPFGVGVGAPLRFQVLDLNGISLNDPDSSSTVFEGAGSFRTEDWDQVEDFFRPIRYVTWGKKEENLYVDVNRVHAITIGHGQLMRRYSGNIDIDEDNLFAEVDGYNDLGGFELMAGPFPIPRLAGGLLFIKPLGLLIDDPIAKSWSVGVSAITDLNAPTVLEKRRSPADQRTQLAVDNANQFVWVGQRNPIGSGVQGIGFDSEVKVFRSDMFDVKVYGDYSHLFFPADTSPAAAFDAFNGGGAAAGGLLRMSFGKTPVRDIEEETEAVQKGTEPREMKAGHAVRVRLEARTFSPQYLPSYWNTLYEVDRLQFGQSVGDAERDSRAELPTKVGFLAGNADEPWRAGVYLEASYAWVDVVAVTLAYEDAYALGDATRPVEGRNLALHAESQGLGFLQLFATYHYRNFEQLPGIFSFNTDNEIFFFGGRLQVLPFMFINAGAQRAFRVGFTNDDNPTPDGDGLRYSSVGLQNVWVGNLDVELGWQF